MTEIILKPELIKGLQEVLVKHDPANEDPILAAQYLSAVVGSIVSTSGIPKEDQTDILKQLLDFIQYVYDQQTSTLEGEAQKAPQNTEEAYGTWKPESN